MVNKKIQLQDDGVNLYPLATLNGIDVNNLLYSVSNQNIDYTATEDCIIFSWLYGSYRTAYIDDIELGKNGADTLYMIPLAKGQRFRNIGSKDNWIKAYGIKR